jgi:endonuclease YncB( thermonuclease family)
MTEPAIMLAAILFGMPLAISFLKAFFSKPKKPKLPARFRSASPYIIDGDTLSVAGVRIRLAGIDAPERGQRQGQQATDHLRRLIGSSTIDIIPIDYDRYGRIVARVFCGEVDLCRQMVVDGYALSDDFTKSYKTEMRRAKKARQGLWSSGTIENPRAFRNSRPA